MRQDPIVFEDWKVDRAPGSALSFIILFDEIITFTILFTAIIFSIIGVYYAEAFFFFILLLSYLFVELIAGRAHISGARSLVELFIFSVFVFGFSSITDYWSYRVIEIVLIILKASLIPLFEVTAKYHNDILVPKTATVAKTLDYQVRSLDYTIYTIDLSKSSKELQKLLKDQLAEVVLFQILLAPLAITLLLTDFEFYPVVQITIAFLLLGITSMLVFILLIPSVNTNPIRKIMNLIQTRFRRKNTIPPRE